MPKERPSSSGVGQGQTTRVVVDGRGGCGSPPPPPDFCNDSKSSSSSSVGGFQSRVQKKFSLASAFPSHNRAHHYHHTNHRQEAASPQQPGLLARRSTHEPPSTKPVQVPARTSDEHQQQDRIRSAPLTIKSAAAAATNRELKVQAYHHHHNSLLSSRKGSVYTRKHSAPVDYRDSGVYLGEIERDPILDMWNNGGATTRGQTTEDSTTRVLAEDDLVALASSAPVSLKGQMKKRFRRNTGQPSVQAPGGGNLPDKTSSSSRSLPSFDSIIAGGGCGSDDQPQPIHRSRTCETPRASVDGAIDGRRPLDDADSEFQPTIENHRCTSKHWDLAPELPARAGSTVVPSTATRLIPQRHAQSLSSENLLNRGAEEDDYEEEAEDEEVEDEEEEEEIFQPSPHASPRTVVRTTAVKANVRFDEVGEDPTASADGTVTKERLVKKRSSMYRRSRSLAEDEATRRALETEMRELGAVGDEEKEDGQRRTRERRGRLGLLRKSAQSTMVQVRETAAESSCKMAKKKRSLADPIAKKLTLTFLRRRPTSEAAAVGSSSVERGGHSPMMNNSSSQGPNHPSSSSSSSPKPPSREEVRKWASSFEHLLSHKYGVMLFRLFLQREFSEENIDFWTACEEYKKLRDPKLATNARQIYNDFVAVQAPKEVNLDSVTRSSTMAALTNPNKRTFEQAQHRIQSLMEKDSYPRFLRSDLYLDLMRKS